MTTGLAKPRVLVVIYADADVYPPTFNAVWVLRSRFHVTLLTRPAGPSTRSWPSDVRVVRAGAGYSVEETRKLSMSDKLVDSSRFFFELRDILRSERPALVYAYDHHALLAVTAAGYRGPLVFHRHEIQELVQGATLSAGTMVVRAANLVARRADIAVFPDAERVAAFRARFSIGPTAVAPNFPLLDRFSEPDLEHLVPARLARPTLFLRGALGDSNGVGNAVEALGLLGSERILHLAGVGETAYLERMRERARALGAGDRLRMSGFIPADQHDATRSAAIGLAAYLPMDPRLVYSVTASNKIYEYAACGLPVIVPDQPRYRRFFAGETWLEFVDESDPASIAGAAERILADPNAYAERCRAARRAFVDRFHFEAGFAPLLERLVAITSRVAG